MHIPLNTCGKGLKLLHTGPILINSNARIGENCVLHINTALVSGSKIGGAPRLGNNVVVFTGAVIVGGVEIADDICIGANALVNKSFYAPGIVIAGVPARKVSDRKRLERM